MQIHTTHSALKTMHNTTLPDNYNPLIKLYVLLPQILTPRNILTYFNNVLTAKLTVFERMYSTKSKLRTVESQRFSLDSSECFAGS